MSIAADDTIREQLPEGFRSAVFTGCASRHPGLKRNIAVSRTTAPFLFFLDDDTLPDVAWLRKAGSISRGGLRVVAGRSALPADVRGIDIVLKELLSCRLVTGNAGYFSPLGGNVRFFDIFLCNACIRRDVFEEIGSFVEKAPYTMDDTEFFRLCELRGIPMNSDNDFVVVHRFTPLWRKFLGKNYSRHMMTGTCRQLFPAIYREIPAIRLADLSPLAILAGILALPLTAPAYAVLMGFHAAGRARLGIPQTLQFIAAAACYHCGALSGYNLGRLRGSLRRSEFREALDEVEGRRSRMAEA